MSPAATSADVGRSAGRAASAPEEASADLRFALCVCAARLQVRATQARATMLIIHFLCENFFTETIFTPLSVNNPPLTQREKCFYFAPLPSRMTLTVSKMMATSNEMERCLI